MSIFFWIDKNTKFTFAKRCLADICGGSAFFIIMMMIVRMIRMMINNEYDNYFHSRWWWWCWCIFPFRISRSLQWAHHNCWLLQVFLIFHSIISPFLNCLHLLQLRNSLCLRSNWLLPLCWYGRFTNLHIRIYLISSLVQDFVWKQRILFFSDLWLKRPLELQHIQLSQVHRRGWRWWNVM